MSPAVRLAGFVAVLAIVFAGAGLAGGAVGPDASAPDARAGGHGAGGAAHEEAGAHAADTAPAQLPGLSVAQDGLRLEVVAAPAERAARAPLRFRILRDDGTPVRGFDVEHTKRMHLIVVRRDLRHFQHLHPTMAADGTWSAEVDASRGGVHRVFADFSVGGGKRTLGTDLVVPGPTSTGALPPAADVARVDGLEVRLRRDGDRVGFDVLRDGRVVNAELEEHLGAKGHLVTLRAGDLAYLHTHPGGDRLAFDVALPTPGAYRSWVQFRLDGVVRTAAFTQVGRP